MTKIGDSASCWEQFGSVAPIIGSAIGYRPCFVVSVSDR